MRNEIQFPELEIFCYFFFYLEHQAVLSLLSGELGYSGADFYLLSILFSH